MKYRGGMPEVPEWPDATRAVGFGEACLRRPQDSHGSMDGRDASA
jgi:hypothetical protein